MNDSSQEDSSYGTIIAKVRVYNPPKGNVITNNTKEILRYWPHNIVFSLDLIPSYSVIDKDLSLGEYFLVQEELEGFIYKIEFLNAENRTNSLNKAFLNLTLPNGTKYSYNLSNETNEPISKHFESPLLLENEGLLKVELSFDLAENTIIWKNNTYTPAWINEDSGPLEYITFQPKGDTTGRSFTFFNFYREGIGVLTSSDMMQQKAILLSERELFNSLRMMDLTVYSIVIAVVGIVSAIISSFLTSYFKDKQKNEKR